MYKTFIICLLLTGHYQVYAQEKERDSILELAEKYRNFSGAKELNRIVTDAKKGLVVKTTKDSLYAANLYLLEAESLAFNWDIPVLRKLFAKSLNMSPNTEEGQILKAETLLTSNFMDVPIGFEMLAYNKSKEALSILESLESTPPKDLLLLNYQNLSILTSTFGNTEKLKEYREKANKLFDENSFDAGTTAGFYNTNIMSLYKTDVVEDTILFYLNKIKTFPNKEEVPVLKFTYASSLNRISEYYYNAYKNGDTTAIKKGYELSSIVINNKDSDKRLNFHRKEAMYHKGQFLIAENKLEEALKNNNELISISKPKDRRMHFNLSQRLIILLKLGKVEDAKNMVFEILEEFHDTKEELKEDYSNFSAKNIVDYVPLFLDISDGFYANKKDHDDVKEYVTLFNQISLDQFKKSIDNKLTTKKTKELFERIVFNLLLAKTNEVNQQNYLCDLLETIENTENTIEWQEFLQQRAYSKLEFIDDFKFEEYSLTNALVEARQKKEDSTISKLELQMEQLKKDFKLKNPNITKYSFSDFKALNFKESLLEDEVTLRYETIKDSLYTFVISKDQLELLNLGASQPILDLTKSYLDDIKNRTDARQKAKELYTTLVPKLSSKFKRLNIIPDDYLYKLPFETLIDQDDTYLMESKTVLYAPYLELLKYRVKEDALNAEKKTNLMIFTPAYDDEFVLTNKPLVRGNEYRLDGAKKESELISEIFPNKSFSDFDATKENFNKYAPDGQLLHLSMHANLDSDTPELSHLIFTEGNTDNKLYLEELYGMNLQAEMAVLSACNTGVGNFELDKGVISLHRAFTQAGVPTTVSSLWEAPDDATQKIMVEFYKQLKSGKTKGRALQLAKINYLKTTKNKELKAPFYWAGFVINGNNNPVMVDNSTFNTTNIVIFIAICILILLAIVFYKKQKWRQSSL